MKRLVPLLAAVAGLLIIGMPGAHAVADKKPEATSLEKVQAYVGPSIVNLQISWSSYVWDGHNRKILKNISTDELQEFTLTSQCTGYVVNPEGYIATAGHCVNPNEIREAMYDQAAAWAAQCACYYSDTTLSADTIRGFSSEWTLKHYDEESDSVRNGPSRDKVQAAWSVSAGGVDVGKALPARVVKFQTFTNGDGALLKVDQSNLPALPLISGAPDIGARIVAVGFPGSVDKVTDPDLEPSYKEGSIGSKSSENEGLTSVYEISAATSGGMSGGPVVNTKGEVLGFVDFKNAEETQAFNFMRPVSVIKELAVPGSENSLDSSAKAYRAGLTAYFAGDKATAVKNLQKVVDEQPTNKFATKYLDLAKKLPNPPKPESNFPVLPVVLGVAALLLIVAVVVGILVMRGRKDKSGPPPGGPMAAGAPYPPTGTAQTAPSAPVASAPQVAEPTAPISSGAPQAANPPAEQPAPPPSMPVGFASTPNEPQAPAPASQAGPAVVEADAAPTVPTQPTGAPHFCGNCGTASEPGKHFCANCGAAL